MKTKNFFFSLQKTPSNEGDTAPSATASSGLLGKVEDLSVRIWLLEGRLIELVFVSFILWRSLRGDRVDRLQSLLAVALLGSYALPYLVGFNYERHITPFLAMVFACGAYLAFTGRHILPNRARL